MYIPKTEEKKIERERERLLCVEKQKPDKQKEGMCHVSKMRCWSLPLFDNESAQPFASHYVWSRWMVVHARAIKFVNHVNYSFLKSTQ